jgi:sialidase-1
MIRVIKKYTTFRMQLMKAGYFVCFIIGLFTFLMITSCKSPAPALPAFYDIFLHDKEDIRGHAGEPYERFREPNVVMTASGRIVVVVQGRNISDWWDRSGQDLYCKFSDDHGISWSDPVLMVREGEKSIVPNATVYDPVHGRIITLYNVVQWPFTDPESRHSWEGPENRQYLVYSDDEGLNWSTPRDISEVVVRDTCIQIFGAGEGIRLQAGQFKGRLIVPGGDFCGPYKHVFAWISDDYGDTWRIGESVPNPHERITPCENAIVELADGRLLMSERSHEPGWRWQAYSEDGGDSWQPFFEVHDIPDVSCNASIIRIEYHGQDVLLYAGPVGPDPDALEGAYVNACEWNDRRVNGTLFASFDNGLSWPLRMNIEPGFFAYSSLIELRDGHIGLVFEANDHQDIRMVRISKDWIFSNHKSLIK